MEFLISIGHSMSDVRRYTPRQITALTKLAMSRRKREMAENLSINSLASQGKPDAIKKSIKDLVKDG